MQTLLQWSAHGLKNTLLNKGIIFTGHICSLYNFTFFRSFVRGERIFKKKFNKVYLFFVFKKRFCSFIYTVICCPPITSAELCKCTVTCNSFSETPSPPHTHTQSTSYPPSCAPHWPSALAFSSKDKSSWRSACWDLIAKAHCTLPTPGLIHVSTSAPSRFSFSSWIEKNFGEDDSWRGQKRFIFQHIHQSTCFTSIPDPSIDLTVD